MSEEFDDFMPPQVVQAVRYVMEYANFGGLDEEVELILDELDPQLLDSVGEEKVRRFIEASVSGGSRRP